MLVLSVFHFICVHFNQIWNNYGNYGFEASKNTAVKHLAQNSENARGEKPKGKCPVDKRKKPYYNDANLIKSMALIGISIWCKVFTESYCC